LVRHESGRAPQKAQRKAISRIATTAQASSPDGIMDAAAPVNKPKCKNDTSMTVKGSNQLKSYWWGYRVKLNNCHTKFVLDNTDDFLMLAGFIAAVSGSMIKQREGTIIGIAIAIVGLGRYLLGKCAASGRGVRVYHGWFAGAQAWCRSQ
jgi:hypothetical protein